MAQDVLVREQIDGGRELLDKLAAEGIEITAAFWAKETESGYWYLFIASPAVEERGIALAYQTVHTAVRNLPDRWLDPFEIKLLKSADGMAVAAQQLIAPNPPPASFRSAKYYDAWNLGGIGVDGAYVYLTSHPAPAA